MSDVLTDFIEPYAHLVDTEEAYRRLLTLAVVAWNAALLPEDKRQAMVDDILEHGLPAGSNDLTSDLRDIVRTLIARKKSHFPEIRRAIIDFELKDTGKGWHLSVASTIAEDGSRNLIS